jgi:hypothetical protein
MGVVSSHEVAWGSPREASRPTSLTTPSLAVRSLQKLQIPQINQVAQGLLTHIGRLLRQRLTGLLVQQLMTGRAGMRGWRPLSG